MPANRRFLPGAALAAMTVVLGACQSNNDSPEPTASTPASVAPSQSVGAPSASPAGSAAASAGAGEATSMFDLEVGDCFSEPDAEASTVMLVDCAETHIYEAYFVFDHEAGGQEPYPGDDEMQTYADERCEPPFLEYVGTDDYQASIYWITSITPSEETWGGGDREIVCSLRVGEDGEPTTGSAEGTGQ